MIAELVFYMYGYDYVSLSLTTFSSIPVPAIKLPKYCQKNDGQLRPFSYNHRYNCTTMTSNQRETFI